jgi:phosphoglycolate phosphatase
MKYQYVLFDLDGTLTDPAEGITKSVEYALSCYGITVADRRELYPFIGPPLADSFMEYYGFDESTAKDAVAHYREYFSVKGIFENRVYDGVRELLHYLSESGRKIILATSKPAVFASRILEHFDLAGYFAFISGSELDGRRVDKREVIAYAMEHTGAAASDCIMIGDRIFDARGANGCGMDFAAALYGYGSAEEFSRFHPVISALSAHQLTEFFSSLDAEE